MDPNALTPAEQAFFDTGELSPELAAQAQPEPSAAVETAPPIIAPVVETAPAIDPVVELREQLAAEKLHRAQLQESMARIAERLEASQAAPKVETPVPNIETDPLGALMHQLKVVTENVTRMQETQTQQQQQAQQVQQFQQFQQNLQQVRNDFTKAQPDFPQAYAHLRAQRTLDLRDVGVPEANIQEALLRDEIAATQTALSQGKNPAKVMYEMAKRYGYAGKPALTGVEKLASAAAGQAAADVTLPKEGNAQQLTFEGLKDASNGDLNKLVQDDKAWQRLVGNRDNSIF